MKETLNLSISYDHDIYRNKCDSPKHIYLLLHGFSQTGEFIFNKLIDYLPKDSLILAPNAPFLYAQLKDGEYKAKYAWYFYDPKKDSFYINYEPAAQYLCNLLKRYNVNNSKVTIIGYSQGGYLAPKVAQFDSNIKKVIGIACKFRNSKFNIQEDTVYNQIHALNDDIVDYHLSKKEFELLNSRGNLGSFITIDDANHLLTQNYITALSKLILTSK